MINAAKITGILVSIKPFGKESGIISVAVKSAGRLKDENTARDDYVVFNYNDETKTKNIAGTFKVGDHITVNGHIGSYIRHVAGSGPREVINFYADTIELTKTDFEKTFGVSGGHFPQDQQSICVEGTIDSVSLLGTGVLLRLNMSEGRTNYLTVMAQNPHAKKIMAMNLGDKVYVCAKVRTAQLKTPTNWHGDYNRFTLTAISKVPDTDTAA